MEIRYKISHHFNVDKWGECIELKFSTFEEVRNWFIKTSNGYDDIYLVSFFNEVIVGDNLENLLIMMEVIVDSPLAKEFKLTEPIDIYLQHYDNFEDANEISQDIRGETHNKAFRGDNNNNIIIEFSDN
jgi:hypothetical protein